MKTHKEPKKKDYKDGEIAKLKKRIARLLKDNNKLKSEVKTLEETVRKNREYITDELEGIPIEKVLEGIDLDKTMNKIIEDNTCPECNSTNMYTSSGGYGTLTGCRDCTYTKIKR